MYPSYEGTNSVLKFRMVVLIYLERAELVLFTVFASIAFQGAKGPDSPSQLWRYRFLPMQRWPLRKIFFLKQGTLFNVLEGQQ